MSSVRPLALGDDPDDGTVLDAFVKLLVAEPAERNSEGLAGLVRRSLRLRGWLDAVDARIAVRANELADQGGEAAATVLAGGGRRSKRDAEAAAARGAVCSAMPQLGAALADGAIGAGHVDVVAHAARHLDDEASATLAGHAAALVNAATTMSPEEFDREVRGLARDLTGDGGLSHHEQLRRQRNVARWVDRHTGMCKTLLTLDPLADAKVWTAFNAAIGSARAANQDDDDERSWDQLRTDAIVDHITRRTADSEHAVQGAEVSVLIDYQALLHGDDAVLAETADGQELPVEVIRRLCCDGTIVPVWLNGGFEVLAVGRQCRLATRAQRRALRAMYRTCCLPDCTVGFEHCRIHHVDFWEHCGPTDLDNLVPICELHHHRVHEGGWRLQLHAGRRITLLRPDGTTSFDGVTTNRTTAPPKPTAPTACQRQRPPPTTAAEVAEGLERALHNIAAHANAP